MNPSNDGRFTHYAEANVDAPQIWSLFHDLCYALLGPVATVIASEIDEAPVSLGSADVRSLMSLLERYKYHLAHDGSLQLGLLQDQDGMITEVVSHQQNTSKCG
jgi:hypothetical protein